MIGSLANLKLRLGLTIIIIVLAMLVFGTLFLLTPFLGSGLTDLLSELGKKIGESWLST